MRTAAALILVGALLCAVPVGPARAAALESRPANAIHPSSGELARSRDAALSFWQLDIDVDEGSSMFSDWGAVDLELTGTYGLLYFNLAVNGAWVIQNLPVVILEGGPGAQVTTSYFGLGVAPGTPVDELTYGYGVTSTTLSEMPDCSTPAPVGHRSVYMRSGEIGNAIAVLPPEPIMGGPADDYAVHSPIAPYPNQECAGAECVPAAVSNSLLWLNDMWDIGIDPEYLSIESLKPMVGWTNGGSPAPPGPPPWWWHLKRDNVVECLPFQTRTTRSPAEVMDVLLDHDVEVRVPFHVASVVVAGIFTDGRWWITYVHDVDQGNPGGTVMESAIYDPGTHLFTGTGWFKGVDLGVFVIEWFDYELGACCVDSTACVMAYESECDTLGGVWLGGPTCLPDPCAPLSVEEKGATWGTIKALYR